MKKILLVISLMATFSSHSVEVEIKNNNLNIPEESLLLINENEDNAIKYLIKNKKEPFNTFIYKEKEHSDLVIAIENNFIKYLEFAIPKVRDINKRYKYKDEDGFTLLMHVAALKDNFTYKKTLLLLKNGANENFKSKNGLNALNIANEVNNIEFMNAYNDFLKELAYDDKYLSTNEQQSDFDIIYSNRIYETLINEKINSLKLDKDKMFKLWIKFIILGQNKSADILYEELKKDKNFNINKQTESGTTGLTACAISNITGGNVEYAIKLIKDGANINEKSTNGLNSAQSSLTRNNYKVLYVLLKNGYNPFNKDDEGSDLFDVAITEPISIKSAYIIKRFSTIK